jgi:16S rRNA G527 N7-methylase RsmG
MTMSFSLHTDATGLLTFFRTDRLDVLHHVYRLCLGGELCRTPLQNPQKVLDVGTGTGLWAVSSKLTPMSSTGGYWC